jgi:hypothetical protein
MKGIILTLVTIVIASTSLLALEPIAVVVESTTGQGFTAQLVDYGNAQGVTTIYTESLSSVTPNSSGLIAFIVGAGSSDWTDITANSVTAYYVLNMLDSTDKIIAQYRLDGLINTSAKAGTIGGNLTVGGDAKINGYVLLSDPAEFTNNSEWSSATGTTLEYTGDSQDDPVFFNTDDLSSDIPDNTVIYIVNNSAPNSPDDSDLLFIDFGEGQDAEEKPIFPATGLSIIKIGGKYFPMGSAGGF